jgi:putative ABC transport system ATP-binding protein
VTERRQRDAGGQVIPALRGVTVHVARGEFVAIVGSSGSGKSTLLHLLGGLDRPTKGTVVVDGVTLGGLSERALTEFRSKRIGFVFQFFNLVRSLTVYENVALPFIVGDRTAKQDQDRVSDMLELFGLRGRADRHPANLSAGEQQRVAIARAFVTEPAIVIADEPTGNVDPVTGTEILQLLWESCDNFGQTVVLATHDPQVAAFADRVLFIKDGLLAEELTLGRRDDHRDAGLVLDRLRRLSL